MVADGGDGDLCDSGDLGISGLDLGSNPVAATRVCIFIAGGMLFRRLASGCAMNTSERGERTYRENDGAAQI